MTTTPSDIDAMLREHCLVLDVSRLPRGHTRIGTKLSYLDGSGVDVFILAEQAGTSGFVLSDLGQTMAKLMEIQVRPGDRLEMIDEATRDLGVRKYQDRLMLAVPDQEGLSQALIDMAQACIRVSCLSFTRRVVKKREFAARVHRAMTGLQVEGMEVEKDFLYPGPFRKDVKVDYRVRRDRRAAAVLALGPSHTQANEVFRKWSDIKKTNSPDSLITIYDDTREPDYEEDLARLEDVSRVISVTNAPAIREMFAAA